MMGRQVVVAQRPREPAQLCMCTCGGGGRCHEGHEYACAGRSHCVGALGSCVVCVIDGTHWVSTSVVPCVTETGLEEEVPGLEGHLLGLQADPLHTAPGHSQGILYPSCLPTSGLPLDPHSEG